ncbi:MAG: hypothetical protein ABI488_06095 [Polyangiaceae bacterium]
MTHPPCAVDWPCQNLQENIAYACKEQGANAPVFCQEEADLPSLGDRAAVQRYGAAVTADQLWAQKVRERLSTLRAQIEPLATRRTAAVAALKTRQTDFDKGLRAARSAYDKYAAAAKKPGAVGLDATPETLRAQFSAAASYGQALSKDEAAIAALEVRLHALNNQLTDTDTQVIFSLQDIKSAAGVVDSMASQLATNATKQQGDAASKQKVADKLKASLKSDPTKLAAATHAAVQAKELSTASADDAVQAKAIKTQAAATTKAVKALGVELEIERKALQKLASPASGAKSKPREQDRQQAQTKADELDRAVKAAADRHRPDAPKAKNCDMLQVDFNNFTYSTYPGDAGARYKKGTVTSSDWDGMEAGMKPHVASSQLVDLDGDGKKDAVVYIEGPPSAHSGGNNELHFFVLDSACRVQQLLALSGPVSPGEMKGKSHFYGDLEMGGVEGMGGNFPVGGLRIELRLINDELKESSRKRTPLE